eukprot:1985833-Prymnesium_polylepis.1
MCIRDRYKARGRPAASQRRVLARGSAVWGRGVRRRRRRQHGRAARGTIRPAGLHRQGDRGAGRIVRARARSAAGGRRARALLHEQAAWSRWGRECGDRFVRDRVRSGPRGVPAAVPIARARARAAADPHAGPFAARAAAGLWRLRADAAGAPAPRRDRREGAAARHRAPRLSGGGERVVRPFRPLVRARAAAPHAARARVAAVGVAAPRRAHVRGRLFRPQRRRRCVWRPRARARRPWWRRRRFRR